MMARENKFACAFLFAPLVILIVAKKQGLAQCISYMYITSRSLWKMYGSGNVY